MPTYERNGKSSQWIWLLVAIVLAILVFFFIRTGSFTLSGRREARQSNKKSLQPVAEPLAGRAPNSVPQPLGSASMQQTVPTTPASDNWYTTVAFKGVVLNEMNRTPVDGATVRVTAFSSSTVVVEKPTGAGGTFQVVAPPGYRYGIKVDAPGFRPYQEDSFVITRPYYDMEILLMPVLSLRGRAVDNQGTGISDVLVQLRREFDSSPALLSVTTDQQGAFAFTEVPRNGRFWVEAFHPGFFAQGSVTVTVPSDGDVLIRMNPARTSGSLAGTVTDTTRNLVAGAKISVYDPSDGRLLSTVLTNQQGQYKFAKMRDAFYLVRCTADGFTETRTNQSVVAIPANRETRLDFSLDPGLQIRGIVVNQKEDPVVQAQVTYGVDDSQKGRSPAPESTDPGAGRMNPRGGMQRARNLGVTTTDNEGKFQILGLSDAQYQVSVSHRDYLSLVSSLRPSNLSQTLVLDEGLSLRGTVSDAKGAAVERFTLAFQSTSGRSEKACSFTTSDGHFEVRGLARDSYQVSLQTAGRGSFSGRLDLQTSTEIFVILEPGRGGRGQNPLNLMKK